MYLEQSELNIVSRYIKIITINIASTQSQYFIINKSNLFLTKPTHISYEKYKCKHIFKIEYFLSISNVISTSAMLN